MLDIRNCNNCGVPDNERTISMSIDLHKSETEKLRKEVRYLEVELLAAKQAIKQLRAVLSLKDD